MISRLPWSSVIAAGPKFEVETKKVIKIFLYWLLSKLWQACNLQLTAYQDIL